MNAQNHRQLLEDFLSAGGNSRIAESLKNFSLQNYAKLKYEYKRLGAIHQQETPKEPLKEESGNPKTEPPKRKVFNDLISDYPVELHPAYRRRWDLWMQACSLKMQLNKIPETETESALEIQMKIYRCFLDFDQCQKVLKHYREHKRIMPLEAETDFEGMSELEIYKYRDNLRALITRRKQTIKKMENSLPAPEDPDYKSRLHTLNLKREQLQEKENELMECEKFLNNGK